MYFILFYIMLFLLTLSVLAEQLRAGAVCDLGLYFIVTRPSCPLS